MVPELSLLTLLKDIYFEKLKETYIIFERTVVSASDLKTGMVGNSEIIFIPFV